MERERGAFLKDRAATPRRHHTLTYLAILASLSALMKTIPPRTGARSQKAYTPRSAYPITEHPSSPPRKYGCLLTWLLIFITFLSDSLHFSLSIMFSKTSLVVATLGLFLATTGKERREGCVERINFMVYGCRVRWSVPCLWYVV